MHMPAPPPRGLRAAILQSAYIPWKGYFDLIASVDVFVLYDDVQYTKNDWRNRNRIKTPNGLEWLTVPVGQDIGRRIRDVLLNDPRWQAKHWKTLVANHARAAAFDAVAPLLAPLWLDTRHETLSGLNRALLEAVCGLLGIKTRLVWSWELDTEPSDDRSARLAALCRSLGADTYVSGPAARAYLDTGLLERDGIRTEWFEYGPYPAYPQLWGPFAHEVSILDLLFNCGEDAPRFLGHART
jgi:hypothetical protein